MTSARALKRTVFLTGEADLVREFGGVCLAANLDVVCHPAPGGAKISFTREFREFRISATVPKRVIAAVELTNTDPGVKKKNLVRLDRALPAGVPIISSSVTVPAAAQGTWLRHPKRLAGYGAFPTLMEGPLAEIALPPESGKEIPGKIRDFFSLLGKELSVVQDRVGLVMPRILCMIINEACFALTEEIASPRDIDTAMKLGTNYPRGPLEWAARAGIGQVIAVLDALRSETGEERYRAAPLLRQMVFLKTAVASLK